jgi:hypothetical protein
MYEYVVHLPISIYRKKLTLHHEVFVSILSWHSDYVTEKGIHYTTVPTIFLHNICDNEYLAECIVGKM